MNPRFLWSLARKESDCHCDCRLACIATGSERGFRGVFTLDAGMITPDIEERPGAVSQLAETSRRPELFTAPGVKSGLHACWPMGKKCS